MATTQKRTERNDGPVNEPDFLNVTKGLKSWLYTLDHKRIGMMYLFGILISLFERAYLLVYEEHMDKQTRRMWRSWEDYMREWVRRADFRDALPSLLEGEDEDFTHHISELVNEDEKSP
jgi:hypothetical protein